MGRQGPGRGRGAIRFSHRTSFVCGVLRATMGRHRPPRGSTAGTRRQAVTSRTPSGRSKGRQVRLTHRAWTAATSWGRRCSMVIRYPRADRPRAGPRRGAGDAGVDDVALLARNRPAALRRQHDGRHRPPLPGRQDGRRMASPTRPTGVVNGQSSRPTGVDQVLPRSGAAGCRARGEIARRAFRAGCRNSGAGLSWCASTGWPGGRRR